MSEMQGAHRAPEEAEPSLHTPDQLARMDVAAIAAALAQSTAWDGHNPGVTHFKRAFAFAHLPPELQEVSAEFAVLADYLVRTLESGPELAVALRKLWESKNSAVLQRVYDRAAEAALAAVQSEV